MRSLARFWLLVLLVLAATAAPVLPAIPEPIAHLYDEARHFVASHNDVAPDGVTVAGANERGGWNVHARRFGDSTEQPIGSAGVFSAPRGLQAGDEVFHYTQRQFVESIQEHGLRSGSYATPSGNLSPIQAHIELSLPPNTPLRDAVLRVDVAGLRQAGYEIPGVTRVSNVVRGPGGRVYTMPGGGYELNFPYAIPPEFIKVVR